MDLESDKVEEDFTKEQKLEYLYNLNITYLKWSTRLFFLLSAFLAIVVVGFIFMQKNLEKVNYDLLKIIIISIAFALIIAIFPLFTQVCIKQSKVENEIDLYENYIYPYLTKNEIKKIRKYKLEIKNNNSDIKKIKEQLKEIENVAAKRKHEAEQSE
ncbi:hypothetical protein [Ligilactobacillus acidipiscis]|uniref:hypothetical protein n=1 Tax=Ligilactobacillus acidipiscis TaxID=89059 RepID=UPI0023F6453B|nr:hypothetical protein [Ligilactobacillus acidipiscis]WEV57867.1 hypothetical protein OZX66_04830 [Ligilactobacillus acidipiscis]